MTYTAARTGLPKRSGTKYLDAIEHALTLPEGQYVQLGFETDKESQSARISIYIQIKKRGLPIQVYARGNDVFIGKPEAAC